MKDAEIFGKDPAGVFRNVRTTASGETVGAGIGRTVNPAAVSDGAPVSSTHDKLGRQIVYPYQVRDLIATGYAALTRSQEATVLSAVAGAYLDLVSLTASNTSSVAVAVDIRDVSGGNINFTLVIPIGSTIIKDFSIPRPQGNIGNVWTAQLSLTDQSDSPVTVSMTAIQNT